MIFAAVDIETTGLSADSQVIQVAVQIGSMAVVYDVGHPLETLNVKAEALAVNGFTLARIMAAPSAVQVDAQLCKFLVLYKIEPQSLIPVGWNVGSFDMPFVRRTFPHAATFFHPYRSLDLNSVCFAIGDTDGYDKVKKAAQAWAKDQGPPGKEHDAGYDARTSMLALLYLQGLMRLEVAA